jgi:hypothetical protein
MFALLIAAAREAGSISTGLLSIVECIRSTTFPACGILISCDIAAVRTLRASGLTPAFSPGGRGRRLEGHDRFLCPKAAAGCLVGSVPWSLLAAELVVLP